VGPRAGLDNHPTTVADLEEHRKFTDFHGTAFLLFSGVFTPCGSSANVHYTIQHTTYK
jgi:hypothetical protein